MGKVEHAIDRAEILDAPVHPADQRLSKKLENHAAALALHFMAYNVNRVHGTLKTTPAVAAGAARRSLCWIQKS